MLPRSHSPRQISDMHFGVTSGIHNCFDISRNKSAGARRRPTRIAVWAWAWEWKVKSDDHTERSYSIERLWVGGFSYLQCISVAFEQDSACVARQQQRYKVPGQVDIMFDICNLAIVNYFWIELQRGWATQEPHSTQQRSHIRQMLCVVPHPHSHPHLHVARFFVSLPCPSGVCCFSAAFEACAVIAAICCPAQQHYLRVLDFCAKRS